MRASVSKENASVKRHRSFFEALEERRLFTTFTVNPVTPISATNFHTIQAAVNAVTRANTNINVAPGIYSEQVLVPAGSKYSGLEITGGVSGNGGDGHGGDGHGDDGHGDDGGDNGNGHSDASVATPNNSSTSKTTIIQAPSTPLSSTGAIVEISGAQNVTITNVTVRAGASASAGVAGLLYGVLVDGGASATISQDVITNIRQDATHLGNTVGYGIGVTSGSATITQCQISNYQRGGILVAPTTIGATGPATSPIPSAIITLDTIDGSLSPVQTIHNGIVFLDGATGVIAGDLVTGNVNTITVPAFFACDGVLLENSGAVSVSLDLLNKNDTNLVIDAKDAAGNNFYGSAHAQVSFIVSSNATYDGIDVFDGTAGLTISHVVSDNNGWSGLFFDSTSAHNTVSQSEFKSNNRAGLGFADIEDDTPESGAPLSGISNGGPHFGTQNTYTGIQLTHGALSISTPPTDFFDPNW